MAEDHEGNLWTGTDAGVDRSVRAVEVEGAIRSRRDCSSIRSARGGQQDMGRDGQRRFDVRPMTPDGRRRPLHLAVMPSASHPTPMAQYGWGRTAESCIAGSRAC